MAESNAEDKLLAHALVGAGLLKREQLDEALAHVEANPGTRLREELVRRGWVTEEVLKQATEASIQGAPAPTAPTVAPTAPTVQPPPGTDSQRPTVTVGTPSEAPTVGGSKASTISLKPDESGTAWPPEVTEASQNPKNTFGKYVLVRQLGAGGMAVVYKAWDTYLNHFVALKFIKTQDLLDVDSEVSEKQVNAFLAEARLAVRLNHPNIARVYELGEQGEKFYMAQYYIDGPSLHEVIHGTRGRSVETLFYQNPKRYVTIMRDLAEAMGYAHRLDPPIIHRDLKPSNVMLDSSGRAYVVDFGLAKELKVDGGSMSGAVKGTPKYMAPEQAEGRSEDMDGRTDIWALGVILYEMLTGRAPFEDDNLHRLLSKIVTDDAPWPRHVVTSKTARVGPATAGALSVPRDVETIAMKCLQKDRRHRYANAGEIVKDLDRVLKGEEVSVPEHSLYWMLGRWSRAFRRHRWAVLAAVLGIGVLLGAFFIRGGMAPDTSPRPPGSRLVPETVSPGPRPEIAAIRDAFLGSPSEETLSALVELIGTLEPAQAPEARQGVGVWWNNLVSTRSSDVAGIYGTGRPRKEWLDPSVRRRVVDALSDLGLADRAYASRKDLGLPENTELDRLQARCKEILDWKGTFTLAANVHPWAEVRIRVGEADHALDTDRQENVTPMRCAGVRVGNVRMEFTRDGERKTVTVPEGELRDGAHLRVWGTWEKLNYAID